ncbi:MAG: hypothetical protein Q9184_004375 [Pyrenodesmia sp. 2 TL-2023]
MASSTPVPRNARNPETDPAKIEAHQEYLKIQGKARRAEEILHGDLRTNLNSFSSWLHVYIVSPDRQLSNKGIKQLEKLVARRRKNVTKSSNDIITEEMRHVIDLWEQEPMQVGSTEWRRARIREIRDMFIADAINEIENVLAPSLSKLEKAEVPQTMWRGPIDKQFMSCRPEPAVPRMKELKWTGAENFHDPRAQVLVDTCSDEPKWKVDFRTHRDQAQAKSRLKLAARIEAKKSKGKKKKKAQKARKIERRQGGDAESDQGLAMSSETAGRSPSAPLMAADIVGRIENDEELGPMEPDLAAVEDDVLDGDEGSGDKEISDAEEDL